MSWNDGYVSELEYIIEYTRELNPLMLKFALLANGYRPPNDRPLRYLELGFGQGLSLNIHAAACDDEFWGNDFNPSHTVNARIMAQTSGAVVTIFDDSFAELAAQKNLPSFDVIVLHGIWSWVSEENCEFILDIVRSKLALGGILYISYNTTPGWSTAAPIQHLIMLHSEQASYHGSDVMQKVKDALSFTQQVIDVEAGYFGTAPAAVAHFERMKKEDPAYLVHEYHNSHWTPTSFDVVSKHLASCGVTFAGDASVNAVFYDSLLPIKIKNLLAEIKDPIFYQSARDFCIPRMFRRDLWIKGGIKLTSLQQMQCIAEIRFTLLSNPSDERLTIPSPMGDIPFDEKSALLVIGVLAQNDYAPKTVNDLLRYPELKHLNLAQACDLMMRLCGRYIAPAHDEAMVAKLKPRTDKLNAFLINQAQHSGKGKFLASPVTGGGIYVPCIEQLFLLAIKNGVSSPTDIVNFVWQKLSSLGHCMSMPDGTSCRNERENVDAIMISAKPFFENHLGVLKALKVA